MGCRPVRKVDNFTAMCEQTVWKMCELVRLTTLWAFMACYRERYLLNIINNNYYYYKVHNKTKVVPVLN
jgi:hypothetical protein